MGCGFQKLSSGNDATPPNPNPKYFRILNTQQCGKYLVAMIEYPGCATYEGKKLLVYYGILLSLTCDVVLNLILISLRQRMVASTGSHLSLALRLNRNGGNLLSIPSLINLALSKYFRNE